MFKISYLDVHHDLVSRLYQVAYTLETMRERSGAAFLALGEAAPVDWPPIEDYDLALLGLKTALPSLHRFASLGENDGAAIMSPAIESESHLGQLRLIHDWSHNTVVDSTSHWLQGELGIVFGATALGRMIEAIDARLALDESALLRLAQVAVLSGIDERTVRNATHLTGESRLEAEKLADGSIIVQAAEARRWLTCRSGFAATTWASAPTGILSASPPLLPGGLLGFLQTRLYELRADGPDLQQTIAFARGEIATPPPAVPGSAITRLNEELRWPAGRLQHVLSGLGQPLNPGEVARLATALALNRRWLECQVNAKVSTRSLPPALHHVFDEAAGAVTVTLTAAGIANGYLDIPTRHAERLFPADAFGGRAGDTQGAQVTLVVEGEAFDSDIRRQSKAMTSPRKRFNGWFRRCKAQPGDRVRIEREGERRFSLSFMPIAEANPT